MFSAFGEMICKSEVCRALDLACPPNRKDAVAYLCYKVTNVRLFLKYFILIWLVIKMEWCPEEDSNLHTLSGTST